MKLLLLIHSEADVSHLEAAARAVLNTAITGIWVVFSPSITVNTSEAATKLDAEIGTLRAAERAAAERADYEAAAGYKAQREGKTLDKAAALRDAWKTAPEEDRKARVNAIFKPFIEQLKPKGLNVRITGHSDHYDREQWVAMLNSLSGVWFKEFEPGGFVIGWPESVKDSLPARGLVQEIAGKESVRLQEKIAQAAGPSLSPTEERRAELLAMHHMSLRPLAKSLGIDITGKDTPTLIDSILAAEQKPAAQPEMAEY